MRVFIILAVFFSLQSFQSQGQEYVHRCNYNIKEKETKPKPHRILRDNRFPWYVCLDKSNFSEQEKEWTRDAMRRWNRGFKDFLERNPGYEHALLYRKDFERIPEGQLFMESCSGRFDGTIYFEKRHLEALGQFNSSGGGWFYRFKGHIKMDIRNWDRQHFINVMIHELGHALGLPHARPGTSLIMISQGFDCPTGGEERICSLIDNDFKAFLDPYDLGRVMTNQEYADYERKRKIERELDQIEMQRRRAGELTWPIL